MVQNGHFCAWVSNNWYYYAGKSTRGVNAYITRIGSTAYKVGGATYTDCDKYSSGAASVTWEKDTTLAEGTSLWTGSGIIYPTVNTPFN
ncbi:hypothetical protein KEJ21_01700 [Candidatus Bathyarchaeota archaeon]|nr:hypothetical protein [Candidatus Bathyarchaeota archaeon]